MNQIKHVVSEIVEMKKFVGGVKNLFLVGLGGSFGSYFPAKIFIQSESKSLHCSMHSSREFLYNLPKSLGLNSVVVICSHTGKTPESVDVARYCKENNITTIGISFNRDSELVECADYYLNYSFGDNKDIQFEKPMVELQLVAELVDQTEGYIHYDVFKQGTSQIDSIVKQAQKYVDSAAVNFAKEYKNDKVIITLASGAALGAAYIQSNCIFMEMQWIISSAIHTGEFFHGPFEITDPNIPFILLLSLGRTRKIDERALSFLKKYGKRVEVIDAKELGLGAINPLVVDYFNHSLFNNCLAIYNKHLANERNHPLHTRRYMHKVVY